jgi:hypothetical protein
MSVLAVAYEHILLITLRLLTVRSGRKRTPGNTELKPNLNKQTKPGINYSEIQILTFYYTLVILSGFTGPRVFYCCENSLAGGGLLF